MSTINRTEIQWTDFTANPFKLELPDGKRVNACVKVSPGCRGCYAESIVRHFWPRSETEAGRAFPGFSLPLLQRGKPWLDTELLRKLLRWKPKPPFKSPDGRPKVFAFDMTDFFLDFWPDGFLDSFMAVVAIRQDIDFQILTKRAERMQEYFLTRSPIDDSARVDRMPQWYQFATNILDHKYLSIPKQNYMRLHNAMPDPSQPLPNLWLGVSAEDQPNANRRVPILQKTPAAVRFISYEPAIGPIDWSGLLNGIDQVIIGGESGKARPFDIAWARNTIAQCKAAGVACFMKQCGARIRMPNDGLMEWGREGDCVTPWDPEAQTYQGETEDFMLEDSHGGDITEWPKWLRVREWPNSKVAV